MGDIRRTVKLPPTFGQEVLGQGPQWRDIGVTADPDADAMEERMRRDHPEVAERLQASYEGWTVRVSRPERPRAS
jgi:hypothetical protein